jgi:signal transduction histidine kinase/CheY-like chemotaxis protein
MRNELHIEQSKEMLKHSNQMRLTANNDLEEAKRQLFFLNKKILKIKEEAEERNQMKSAYLANIVHEICTPMNAIRGFAQLLQMSSLTEEDKIKYAQIISQCTDNLLNLVHDLLDISKIEAGQLNIIERPDNLKDLFNELFELFNNNPVGQCKLGLVELKYFIELNHDQYLINVDFIRLRQILINLISNALKFTEKGHVIYGCFLVDTETLCFYVEDTGIGITPEKQTVVFERFKQICDPNSTNKCKGTGLGLSIVKSLVELMNGKVWVESTQGVGSRFYFTLPYKKVIIPKTIIKKAVSYNWSDKNILIVENDDFDISIMNKYLVKSKAKCIYTKDGKSALEYLKSNSSIDLVLLNIHLQDTNGLDLIRKIKKIAQNIPIIAQTDSSVQEDKECVINSGCSDFISKSISKDELLQLIQNQFADN